MSKLDDALSALTESRKSWHPYVEKVDAALAEERHRQLEGKREEITTAVLFAAANGASIADIKRAYGTKDYRTIKSILEAHPERLAAMRAAVTAYVDLPEIEFNVETDTVAIRDAETGEVQSVLEILALEDGGYLLSVGAEGTFDNLDLDGEVAEANGVGRLPAIFMTIEEALA